VTANNKGATHDETVNMVLLTYSRGRGRGGEVAGRGGRSFPASRGRGRGRSMTWTRPQPSTPAPAPAPAPVPSNTAVTRAAGSAIPGSARTPNAGVHRVWVNTEAKGPGSGGRGAVSSDSGNGHAGSEGPSRPRMTSTPRPTLAPTPRPSGVVSAAARTTSKSVHRVWTNAGRTNTTAHGAGSRAGSTSKAATLPKPAKWPPPGGVTVSAAAPALRGGTSAAPRTGHGHLVWTNAAAGGSFRKTGGGRTGTSTSGSRTISAHTPGREAATAVSVERTTAGAAPTRKNPAQAALTATSRASAAVAAPKPKPAVSSSSPTKPVSRYSGAAGWDLKARQSKTAAAASASGTASSSPGTTPVARYSGSAARKHLAAVASTVGKGKGPSSTRVKLGQQVARYSAAARGGGARGNNSSKAPGAGSAFGRPNRGGRGTPAWRGRGGRTGGGAWRGSSVGWHRGWSLASRRGMPAWRGRWGGLGYSLGGRGRGGLHSRHPEWFPPTSRFQAHPASRWAAGYWAHPWASRYADHGRGRGR
ncbi:unnamed protein product, partial [Scytosiphon promiscuus]